MEELDKRISDLEERLDRLVRTQIDFQREVSSIRGELSNLRGPRLDAALEDKIPDPNAARKTQVFPSAWPAESAPPPARPRPETYKSGAETNRPPRQQAPPPKPPNDFFSKYTESARADLEKFIGENLISKIGILVLIIGVGIGVKYSIDNDLISPLTRVILAYLFAFGLVGLAIKLKPKYLNFSAALISGGMAILYFVTYFAYTAYGLIGQVPAFGLMAMFTALTVVAAIFFNRQVIAHIGLVGAYAVPFLLSNESGNYLVLFVYMAMINAGILAISIWKYWRPIFYTASFFTWLIFLGWFAARYAPGEHFVLALVFLAVFAGIFIATRVVHATIHNEHDSQETLLSSFLTAMIFFGFCFAISAGDLSAIQTWNFFAFLAAAAAVLLSISFRYFGTPVVYLTFVMTWLTFGTWYSERYIAELHFLQAAIVTSVFFAIFYISVLAHRLASEKFNLFENAGLILTNSFLYYGFGYSMLAGTEGNGQYLGLYTAGHSVLHLGVAYVIARLKPAAVDVEQLLTVLVLTFASIAIPVQMDGNQVTLAWSAEAAILFWFGRSRRVKVFELFSYPVMALAVGSMLLDWGFAFYNRTAFPSDFNLQPFANGNFVTGLVFVAAFAAIYAINRDSENDAAIDPAFLKPFAYIVATIALAALYNEFRTEIGNYFHLQSVALLESGVDVLSRQFADLGRMNILWQVNYTSVFFAALLFVNLFKVRSRPLGLAAGVLGTATLAVIASSGMILFYELRTSYLGGEGAFASVSIRYVTYLTSAILLFAMYRTSRADWITDKVAAPVMAICFEAVLYVFCFVTMSCELLNLMAQFDVPEGRKLGLSIFWGIYALMLIVIGIAWNRKHLRVAAIALLGVTLAKLFFYDVADLETIPRTILFVTLGLTLLLISFLYNKYKNAIFGLVEEGEEET